LKIIKSGLLLICCLSVVWGAAASGQREIKKYFPGDYVHIIVTAPQDTVKITSFMPNNDRIELVHDRRANIWYGLWQVPIGFKVGNYTAILEAKDMEGTLFSGETVPFIIGEMTIIAMLKKATSPEAETRAEQSRRLELNTAQLAAAAKPAILPQEAKPPLPAKKKTAVRIKPGKKLKKINFVEVGQDKVLNVTEVKLVTIARYYMAKMDFDKVQTSLKYLIRLDPANQEYRKMLQRVQTVIKTEKEKNK